MLEAISESAKQSYLYLPGGKDILSDQLFKHDQANPDINNLSDREMQIVKALKEGLSSKK